MLFTNIYIKKQSLNVHLSQRQAGKLISLFALWDSPKRLLGRCSSNHFWVKCVHLLILAVSSSLTV